MTSDRWLLVVCVVASLAALWSADRLVALVLLLLAAAAFRRAAPPAGRKPPPGERAGPDTAEERR